MRIKNRLGQEAEVTNAEGTTGFILTSVATESVFFRVYDKEGGFKDYDLYHNDLEVTIVCKDAYFYDYGERQVIDHDPKIIGYKVITEGVKKEDEQKG
jgi:hypothetical protein